MFEGPNAAESRQVPISVLSDESVSLQRQITLVVTKTGQDEFQASFYDANIHATGPTSGTAVQNVLEALVYRFKHYSGIEPARLGPLPRRQLSVLKRILRLEIETDNPNKTCGTAPNATASARKT